MMKFCERHGPYSTFCRECDLETIERYALSYKAEAERQYPMVDFPEGYPKFNTRREVAEAKRAAFINGIKFAEERAALAASGPAAGVGEVQLAWRFQSIMGDHLYVEAYDNEIMGTGAASYAMARVAIASSPPAPAGMDRERVIEALKDIARQPLISETHDDQVGSIKDGYDECIRVARRALASPPPAPDTITLSWDECRQLLSSRASPPPAPAGVDRERVIEECARVADAFGQNRMPDENDEVRHGDRLADGMARVIAAHIRALASEAGPAEGER